MAVSFRRRRVLIGLVAALLVGLTFGVRSLVSSPSEGVTPTAPAVAKKACPFVQVKHTTQTCPSPEAQWVLRYRYDGPYSVCRFSHENAIPERQLKECGSNLTWVKPHLLIFAEDYPLVNSFDPATGKVDLLGQLSDFLVSPNGRWVAGLGPGDPKVDAEANSVYALSVHGRRCLVVPGRSADVAGFTPDSKNLIVRRSLEHGAWQLRQFALSSLRTGCPAGPNGVSPQNS